MPCLLQSLRSVRFCWIFDGLCPSPKFLSPPTNCLKHYKVPYQTHPTQPTLSSVNICITEFCANFYISFSSLFSTRFTTFFPTVFSPGELKNQFYKIVRPLHLLHLDRYQTCLSDEIGLKQSILNRTYPTFETPRNRNSQSNSSSSYLQFFTQI